jgi:hypothetical protein
LFADEDATGRNPPGARTEVADGWHMMIPPPEIRTRIGPFADAADYWSVSELDRHL